MSGHTAERLTLARHPSGIEITTTVHTYEGDQPGPTLYTQAAQHGQEINGAEVLRRFHERFDPDDLTGTLVVVPVADPLTFDRVTYTTPEPLDSVNPNMNRCWPGDADGTLHERMAAKLWAYASDADAIVDLHTGSPDMYTHVVYMRGDAESHRLAEAFGTDLLLAEEADDEAGEEWHSRNFGGKLRVAATNEGIPSITPELSHNTQIVEEAVETGVTGLFNVLRELDMLPDDVEPNGDTELTRNHLGTVNADASGLFVIDPDREVGQSVDSGEHIGTVYDPTTFEVLQEAETDRAGILYDLARESTVTEGDTLLRVALRINEP